MRTEEAIITIAIALCVGATVSYPSIFTFLAVLLLLRPWCMAFSGWSGRSINRSKHACGIGNRDHLLNRNLGQFQFFLYLVRLSSALRFPKYYHKLYPSPDIWQESRRHQRYNRAVDLDAPKGKPMLFHWLIVNSWRTWGLQVRIIGWAVLYMVKKGRYSNQICC